MPLKCQSPQGEEYSFRHASESWTALKALNATERHLTMPCCGARVVLKRSRRGTQFFAHARRGDCTTAPESEQHLLAKDIIARTGETLGWQVTTEQRGMSPTGDSWIADVLCRNPKSQKAIAFEVQWSPQTIVDTEARQAIYEESGVRGLWLMRQPVLPISKRTPAVQLQFLEDDSTPVVRLPSKDYSETLLTRRNATDDRNWAQSIPLKEFVCGTLIGRLQFAPAFDTSVTIRVHAADAPCWKCKRTTSRLMHIELAADERFAGHGNGAINLDEIDAAGSVGDEWLSAYLPNKRLASVGIGSVKRRYSHTVGAKYLSNGCVHCDALQGAFFDHEIAWEAKPVLTGYAVIEPWIANTVTGGRFVNRWWFDRAQVD
jgi:hypothetical protein